MPSPVLNRKLSHRRGVSASVGNTITYDTWETYADGGGVDLLNGGISFPAFPWFSPYAARVGYTFLWVWDTFEQYANSDPLDGANQGFNGLGSWNSEYAASLALNDFQAYDTLESYTNGANLDGLNGGTNFLGTWDAAYVGR